MPDTKTKLTSAGVADFINSITDEQKRKDSFALLEMMRKTSGEEPKMWGSSIIGFGQVKLKSPNTGKEVDWLRIGFSPRKASLSLYISGDINHQHAEALEKPERE